MNWKTTLAGALGAAAVVIRDVVGAGASPADWKTWLLPAAIALLGYLANDKTATATP